MMHGHEKSDPAIVAVKPANKAKEAYCGSICGGGRSGVGGAKVVPSNTRGGSRMRESRTYGSGGGVR